VKQQGKPSLEAWASGSAYEPFIGRWSRLIAREFLIWLAVPPGKVWLDVGCGTGAATEAVVATAAPSALFAADMSAAYAAHARALIRDPRASFAVADAQALPWPTGCAHAAISGLVLNFVPQPALAVAEMARATRTDGMVAAYVWDYANGMTMLRRFWDAAVALDASAEALDEGRRFPLCQPVALAELWRTNGLDVVSGCALEVPTNFRDFDDYWAPFLSGQGPAPSYVAGLAAPAREGLREYLRSTLPVAADGTITMTARAWAVRGIRR
jgi:SAM-dependent methyltransferase